MALGLKPMAIESVNVRIVGMTPMIMHAWGKKAKDMMRDKMTQGKKTKNRDLRDPEQEAEEATYYTYDGKPGFPAAAIKNAMRSAAHKDLGITKVALSKAVFFKTPDASNVIPIDFDEKVTREDMVRVGMGQSDIRWRPEFREWSADLYMELDSGTMNKEDLINLLERAGWSVGIGEWRPEKNGEFGRFRVLTAAEMAA